MTGEEFIQLMEEKQREKMEKEEEKLRKKAEREEKRKERQRLKEEEKIRKKEKKEAKKQERQRLKEEKEKNRQRRKLLIAGKKAEKMASKKKTFHPPFARPSPVPLQSSHLQPSDLCVYCGGSEDFDEEWVSCDNCRRWWHVQCTDTPDMSAQDFNEVSWNCVSCRL